MRYYIFFLLLIIGQQIFSQKLNIKIIETTDVHGNFFPFDFINLSSKDYSLGHVYTYVQSLRDKGENVVLVDNGDIIQGDPTVYYSNFVKDSFPHVCSRLMNYMKYDVGVVGNHDIEAGHNVYDKLKKELKFPWLAANAVHKKTKEPYFEPYTIIERGNIKIAVLGLITPGIPNWLPKNIWSGIEFEDMIVSAKKWVPIIMEKENPDILIGLFHAGIDYTYGDQDENSYKNENATQLIAEQVEGFDIVFAGHDHEEWNFTVESLSGKEVLILGAGSNARSVAQANINLEFDSVKNIWNKDLSGKIINMVGRDVDLEFYVTFSPDIIEIRKYVGQEIGILNAKLTSGNSFFGDSEYMDLIHKNQLEISKADISFAAPLSFYTVIDSGKITTGDMFNLYKFENLLYTMSLKGKEVKKYLEYSYGLWFNQMDNINDHLLKFRKDENGDLVYNKYNKPHLSNQFYNFDSAEGIIYTVDVTKPKGERINILSMTDGSEFSLRKKYKVAINSYRGSGGGGHLTKGAGIKKKKLEKRLRYSTDKDLRYFMMEWVKRQKSINPEKNDNWSVIPKDYFESGYVLDYNLLF